MIKLFDGTAKSISLQLGANAHQGQDIQLDVLSTYLMKTRMNDCKIR